jgi:NAD-dependent deacetylase
MIAEAADIIMSAQHVTAFSGAGISVESGIPPFRGENGLWNRFNPVFLDIDYFHRNPLESWKLIKQIFYDFIGKAEPNPAHFTLAEMEKNGSLNCIITQNIDNLHQLAGSENVIEFHGTTRNLVCQQCKKSFSASGTDLTSLPPVCRNCGIVLKPDFVFFGEPIPEPASTNSFREADISDVFILIGTTGEIMPASVIPVNASRNGAKIIEVNVKESNYTNTITDVFLRGKATSILTELLSLTGNT